MENQQALYCMFSEGTLWPSHQKEEGAEHPEDGTQTQGESRGLRRAGCIRLVSLPWESV